MARGPATAGSRTKVDPNVCPGLRSYTEITWFSAATFAIQRTHGEALREINVRAGLHCQL